MLIRDQPSSPQGQAQACRDTLPWPEQLAKDFWGGGLAVGTESLTEDRKLLGVASPGVEESEWLRTMPKFSPWKSVSGPSTLGTTMEPVSFPCRVLSTAPGTQYLLMLAVTTHLLLALESGDLGLNLALPLTCCVTLRMSYSLLEPHSSPVKRLQALS